MLAVQRRDELACIKIGEADDLDFGKAELRFDGGRYRSQFRLIYAASKDRRDFDLDLDSVRFDEKFSDDILRL